nr:MAG TPA: hypothetical protein [Caudoviricetes sp.]
MDFLILFCITFGVFGIFSFIYALAMVIWLRIIGDKRPISELMKEI